MAGTEDLLKEAFANQGQQTQAFTGSFNAANQIVDTAMKTQAAIWQHQQTIAMQQQQLKHSYLQTGAQIMEKVSDPKTSDTLRANMLEGADQAFQRAGLAPMSEDFKKMFKQTPELKIAWSQAQRNLLDLAQDPKNADKATAYTQAINNIASKSTWMDSANIADRLDTINQHLIAEMGRGLQGQLKVEQGATLEQYREGIKAFDKVAPMWFFQKKLAQTPVPDPTDPSKPLVSGGRTYTYAQAAHEYAIAQPNSVPTTQQNELFQAAISGMKNAEQQATEAEKRRDQIEAAQKDISRNADAMKLPDARRFARTPVTPQNVNQLYDQMNQSQMEVAHSRDVTERGRVLEAQANSVVEHTTSSLSKFQADTTVLQQKIKTLKAILNQPHPDTAQLSQVWREFTQALNDTKQKTTDADYHREFALTFWQRATSAAKSVIDQLPTADLLVSQKNMALDALKRVETSIKAEIGARAWNDYKSLGSYPTELQGQLSRVKEQFHNQAKGVVSPVSASNLKALYDAAQKSYPGPDWSTDARREHVIQEAIEKGYDPWMVDKYFRARDGRRKGQ